MKYLSLTLSFLALFLIAFNASAQITAGPTPKPDTNKVWNVHGENTLMVTQGAFSNWSGGGVNSTSGDILLNYDFNYKKAKWSWDSKAIIGYGETYQKGLGTRKNDDRVILNSLLGYQASKYWLYTVFLNFNTQFTKGYDYTTSPSNLLSAAFAPAYLSFGPGFAYKKSDNFYINFSPAAIRLTFVEDKYLSSIGAFGVDTGKNLKFEFGASLNAYYRANITKQLSMENILKLYSDYLSKPQNVDIDYTLNLLLKVSKYVTINAGLQLVYDDNTTFPYIRTGTDGNPHTFYRPQLQVKELVGAGVTYKF